MNLSKEIKRNFPEKEEVRQLANELNLVLTELSDTVQIGNIQLVMRLNAVLNEVANDTTKKAPEGYQTNPEASVQLSNSNKPFNTAKI